MSVRDREKVKWCSEGVEDQGAAEVDLKPYSLKRCVPTAQQASPVGAAWELAAGEPHGVYGSGAHLSRTASQSHLQLRPPRLPPCACLPSLPRTPVALRPVTPRQRSVFSVPPPPSDHLRAPPLPSHVSGWSRNRGSSTHTLRPQKPPRGAPAAIVVRTLRQAVSVKGRTRLLLRSVRPRSSWRLLRGWHLHRRRLFSH